LVFRRDLILHIFKVCYAKITFNNLPIYHINELSLKNVTTTEKDFLKRVDRFPPLNLRNKYEDLLDHNINNSFVETPVIDDP
jgi:hypothetical protein